MKPIREFNDFLKKREIFHSSREKTVSILKFSVSLKKCVTKEKCVTLGMSKIYTLGYVYSIKIC